MRLKEPKISASGLDVSQIRFGDSGLGLEEFDTLFPVHDDSSTV